MTDLPEKTEYEPGIYQLETTDPVMAGPEGIDNLQAKQLANRTAWLKQQSAVIIKSAGLTPDANNLAQLTEAINALAVVRAQELISGHNIAATTELEGHVELATSSEAIAGVSTTRAITPEALDAVLDARTASTSEAGLVELATNSEAWTGTSASLAITPANLINTLDARTANTSRSGLARFGTETEVEAGSSGTISVSPYTLKKTLIRGVGQVGTYAFLRRKSAVNSEPGNKVAGSSLIYSNASGTGSNDIPSGTWMCCGDPSGTTASSRSTLWIRTA